MAQPSRDDLPIAEVNKSYSHIDWSRLYENVNSGLFKRNNGSVMTYHFKIEDVKRKQQYEELVRLYGGRAITEFVRMGNQTALMVEDNTKVILFSRPSFKTSFIIDCIKKNTLLDISDYLHNEVTFKKDNYMDIIFAGERKFTEDDSNNSLMDGSDSDISHTTNRKKYLKASKVPFSTAEKEAMLKYILLKRKFSGLRGNTIWKSMERRGICRRRTSQSMKNNFLKTVLYELDKYEFLTENDKKLFRVSISSK